MRSIQEVVEGLQIIRHKSQVFGGDVLVWNTLNFPTTDVNYPWSTIAIQDIGLEDFYD